MKVKANVEIDITPEKLARQINDSGDQARFFNSMAEHFKTFSDGDADDMQMLYIKDELTDDGKKFISKLNRYINTDSTSEFLAEIDNMLRRLGSEELFDEGFHPNEAATQTLTELRKRVVRIVVCRIEA